MDLPIEGQPHRTVKQDLEYRKMDNPVTRQPGECHINKEMVGNSNLTRYLAHALLADVLSTGEDDLP
jgi:hypothetical protein